MVLEFKTTPKTTHTEISKRDDYYSECGDYCLRRLDITIGRNGPSSIRTFEDKDGKTVTIKSNSGYRPIWYGLYQWKPEHWRIVYQSGRRATCEKALQDDYRHRASAG